MARHIFFSSSSGAFFGLALYRLGLRADAKEKGEAPKQAREKKQKYGQAVLLQFFVFACAWLIINTCHGSLLALTHPLYILIHAQV
jgi:hypothetical protein